MSFVIERSIGNLQLQNDADVNFSVGKILRFVQKAKTLLDITS